MSIIDTTSWVDAEINRMHQQRELDRRYRLAQEDQALQRQEFDDRRADRTRRLDQERADQNLLGGLWDFISGNQPGTSQPPQDYTNPVLGPPTQQQMQAQQAQPAMPAAGGGAGSMPSGMGDLIRRASPQGGRSALDDIRVFQTQHAKQRMDLERQNGKMRVAEIYEPFIRNEFPNEVVPQAMVVLDAIVNDPTKGSDDLRRAMQDMHDQVRERQQMQADQQGFAAEMTPRTGTEADFFAPTADLSRMSPEALSRIMADRRSRDQFGQRHDNALEIEGVRQDNRIGAMDHRADLARKAKELSPQELEQQVLDVMASNPRAGRVEAEAYVRGRHDGLFNQIRPNISGDTRDQNFKSTREWAKATKDLEIAQKEVDRAERAVERDPENRALIQRLRMAQNKLNMANDAVDEILEPTNKAGSTIAPQQPTATPQQPSSVTQQDMDRADAELPNGTDEEVIARAREIAAKRSGR